MGYPIRTAGERPIWRGKQVPIQFWSTAAERKFRGGGEGQVEAQDAETIC